MKKYLIRFLLAISLVLSSGSSIVIAQLNYYQVQQFAGANFGARLQKAINSVPSGSQLDCGSFKGTQAITASVNVTKPLTIYLPASTINGNVGTGNNMFNYQSSAITMIGISSSAKSDDLNGQTKLVMTSGSWHIYSKGNNVLTLKDFDCLGIKSTPYQYEPGTTTLKTGANSFNNDGSGGICIIENDPFVVGGGISFSKVLIDNIFIKDTRNTGILLLGAITTRVENCRISGAAAHGIYAGANSTTITMINNYVSSAMLGGIVLDAAATTAVISCPVEAAGIGMWLRSCQSVQVFGFYAEGNVTRNTGKLPSNTGLFFDNTEATATLTVSDYATMLSGSHTVSLTNATGTTTLVLTAVAAAPGANQFIAGTSNSVTATNIAAAINASAGNANYTAAAAGSKVTVTWKTLGAGVGNTFSCTGGTSSPSATLATGQILDDIGTDNTGLFKGTSLVITGGRNIYVPNPYSKDPGLAVEGASSTTSHYSIVGNVREVYIPNPRCSKASSGYTGTPRFDIRIEANGSDIPRDINLIFNPSLDGTVTPSIAGKYITEINSSGESTVILDQGTNTEIKGGRNYYTTQVFDKSIIAVTLSSTTLTGEQMKRGMITTASPGSGTITLASATSLATALNAVRGTSFEWVVDNTAGANTVTIALGSGMVQSAVAPSLSVATGTAGVAIYKFLFTSSTTCVVSRVL